MVDARMLLQPERQIAHITPALIYFLLLSYSSFARSSSARSIDSDAQYWTVPVRPTWREPIHTTYGPHRGGTMIPSPTLAPSYATLPPLAGPAPQLHPPSAPDLRSTTPTPGGGSRTPSLTLTATPGQAGSGTPYHTLQTPRADRTGLIEGMQASEDEGDGDAGVGAQGSDSRKGKQRASTGEGGAIGGPEYAEGQQTEEPEEEGLGQAELQGLRRRLDGFKTMPDAGGSSGQAWLEVIGMVRAQVQSTTRAG